MKKIALLAFAAIVGFSSCTGTKSIKNFTEKDSVAYAIGTDLGSYLNNLDADLDLNVVQQGMADAIKGEEKINKDDAYAFLNEYFMVRVPARNLEESTKFLEKVAADNKNVVATESGLLYEIVEMGDTTAMAKGLADEVFVNYKGTLKDGEVFDENDSIRFRLGQVVQGWQEGLQLVGKGGKINLWIPPHLGYGNQTRGKIKANDALVFEVELLDVTPAEAR
ncbi:MAG: FKBP-type peptidyl-prolyl cis-trans isomerase [Rikenellaceae bacterium]|jgi:FKBP-type peptidyl-prolyl cis-trans isomerase|nr:FKBP-type peptidyl-prolyl cis-trans isomerase [Rikenellaceae bacterium]